jgi:FkbM family methyltransferase
MLGEVSTAIHVWRAEGIFAVMNAIIDWFISKLRRSTSKNISRLEESSHQNISILPLILLHEIEILLDEQAIAYPSNNKWKVVKIPELDTIRYLPTVSSRVCGTRHGSKNHINMMEVLYTCENFVKVEQNDIVVDVGAFVGGFSMFAAKSAKAVIAIEPSAKIDDSLSLNVCQLDNIHVVPKAAWHRTEELEINKSFTPNENSILTPDSRNTQESFTVTADTVPNIVRELGFDHIDYLKIEAEGVEPEILEGAVEDSMDIEKIAVDASPERNEQSTVDEIRSILESHGYEPHIKDDERWWGKYIVFAREKET